MSHSSLRSFSSVRSLGNLSPKSPATLSLSRGASFCESPTEELPPAGWFVVGPPRGSIDSLSRALQNYSQRTDVMHRSFTLDPGHAITAPSSPLRPTASTFSRSASSDSNRSKPRDKGKGKENAGPTKLGLRPGAEGMSARTGTRFVMTCPPTPSSGSQKPLPKLDPVLAALERGSKLKSNILAAHGAERPGAQGSAGSKLTMGGNMFVSVRHLRLPLRNAHSENVRGYLK
ncbi:hypothetical protein FRC10_006598 [Ceratobasidium sp. 414]|nr:hypothetical protein FRC10_006598 [Ceratobasidium sp. 414]